MSNRRSSSDHGRGAPDPGGLSDDAKIACVIAGGVGLGLAAYWLFGDSNESERTPIRDTAPLAIMAEPTATPNRERPRTRAVTVLQGVLGRISLDDSERKKNMEVVENYVKLRLVKKMRELDRELFDKLFNRVSHTGSYYDGLRIDNPREFDLNLVINLPFSESKWRIDNQRVEQGFMKISLVSSPSDLLHHNHRLRTQQRALERHFLEIDPHTGVFYLNTRSVSQWVHSLIDRALSALNGEPNRYVDSVKLKQSGPAMTLVIKRHDSLPGEVLEVDLVPAFAFSEEKLLGLSRIGDALRERAGVIDSNFGVPNPHQRKVYAVPKKSARHNDFFWRLSFQEQEGGIIHDMGCIKPVIRLLKKFRDENQALGKSVYSYALKTVAMRLFFTRRREPRDWANEDIGDIFLDALEVLEECLRNRNRGLPHVFDFQNDLLAKLNPDERSNKANWLANQIRKLRNSQDGPQCEDVWLPYFLGRD